MRSQSLSLQCGSDGALDKERRRGGVDGYEQAAQFEERQPSGCHSVPEVDEEFDGWVLLGALYHDVKV